MKKVLFPILALVLAIGLAIPMAAPAAASDGSWVLYGTIGGHHLVTIDETTGDATEVVTLSGLSVYAIAFDSSSGILYGLARTGANHLPHLATIDVSTGIVTDLGEITLPSYTVYFAEGLAIDPSGTIYVSMSINGDFPDYYSETLATVNPTTAVATVVGVIDGTHSGNLDEADGLEFVGTTLYGTDDPGSGPTNIYTYSTGTAAATAKGALSSPRFNNVGDMAYNPVSTLLYGFDPGAYTNGYPRYLCTISHANGAVATAIGITHTAGEFDAATMSGIAWVFVESEEANPEVTITKTSDADGFATINDVITYHYDVENTGDVVLDGLVVTDAIGAWASVPAVAVESGGYNVGNDNPQDDNFDPGEIWEFEYEYTVVEDDLLNCRLHDFAMATAYYEDEPVIATDDLDIELAKIVNLWAGKDTDVGGVEIWNDGTTLHVTYSTEDGWVLTETHLYVGSNEPPTNAPGQFPYDGSDAVSFTDTEVIFEIPLAAIDSYSMQENKKGKPTGKMIADDIPGVDPGEPIYIAAHSVVLKVEGDCEDPFWATGQQAYSPGLNWADGEVPYGVTYYSTDQKMTGAPDAAYLGSTMPQWDGFQSLGFGGSVEITFDYPIFNGPCDYDISVHEVTGLDVAGRESYPEESATVSIWVNGDWEDIGTVTSHDDYDGIGGEDGIGTVSIPEEYLYVEKIKITDTTDKADFSFMSDGYDVDAVDACFLVVQEETAWGGWGDDLPNIIPFEESNWSNYIEYFVMTCPLELRANPPTWNVPDPANLVAGSVWMYHDDVNDELVVFVYLDGGAADTDYLVFLESYPGTVPTGVDMPQWTIIGTLTTDSHGHGTFYHREPLPVGTHYLQIVVGNWGVFGTDIATITIS